MKVRIEIVPALSETEVVIRAAEDDAATRQLQREIAVLGQGDSTVELTGTDGVFYLALGGLLFFEVSGEQVYAHTADEAYRCRYRLYELEQLLPPDFVRISKSAIVNLRNIRSITTDLTAGRVVHFGGTAKQLYVSRRYYAELRRRMQERITI